MYNTSNPLVLVIIIFLSSVKVSGASSLENSALWLTRFYEDDKTHSVASCAKSEYVAEKKAMSQLFQRQKKLTSAQQIKTNVYTENIDSVSEGMETKYRVKHKVFFKSEGKHCVIIAPITTPES